MYVCMYVCMYACPIPISNILSASSNTKYVTRLRLVVPCSKKSIKRPGHATKISTPLCRSPTDSTKQIITY